MDPYQDLEKETQDQPSTGKSPQWQKLNIAQGTTFSAISLLILSEYISQIVEIIQI